MKEKALRETQIRNMHEMGEMERAQEPRVDELETHFTSTRITRKDELFEWLWRILRSRVELQWFANPRSMLESLQTPYQGIHSSMAPNAAGEAPALISTGRLVAREEERVGSTIPMPTFARRPPTMSSFIPVDIPQSSIVGQQRQQISEPQFDKFPTPQSF